MRIVIKSVGGQSTGILLKTHLGKWVGLLFILAAVILLFSNLLLLEQRFVTAELASSGLQASAKLISDEPIPAAKAIKVAATISKNHNTVVVPLNEIEKINCHFETFTEYTTEKLQVIDGIEQRVKTRQSSWVHSGAFDIGLSRAVLKVNPPVFNLFNSNDDKLGQFELLEFTEDAIKLALTAPVLEILKEDKSYYFSFERVKNRKLGPALYDSDSGYFFFIEQSEELIEADLLNHNNGVSAYLDAIFTWHVPFVPGVAVEQLQLGEYENSYELTQYNNKLMLTALLNENERQNGMPVLAKAFLSEPLFRKLFANDFDFKVLKIKCFNKDDSQFEQLFTVQGHYDFAAKQNQNLNQVFIALPKDNSGVSGFNGFLVKDLGDMPKALLTIQQAKFNQERSQYWQIEYLEQLLKSKYVFKLIQAIFIVVVMAILLSLIMPLMKIMRHELFLIKFYGGSIMLSLAGCALLLYIIAITLAYSSSTLFNLYFNHSILATFDVPLVRINEQFFYQAIAIVALLWIVTWTSQIYSYYKRNKKHNLL